jgi:hypothetical protein
MGQLEIFKSSMPEVGNWNGIKKKHIFQLILHLQLEAFTLHRSAPESLI